MLKSRPVPRTQQGIVLLVAIVVLVALTLGALALTRSVYTSNVIAGNLAFQRSATNSAELGIETALKWLEDEQSAADGNCGMKLYCDQVRSGYFASRRGNERATRSWLEYWDGNLDANARTLTDNDAAGNRIQYAIERMCMVRGDPTTPVADCTVSPQPAAGTCSGGSSCAGGEANLGSPPPVYYRITVRVTGPRNAQSLVQTMVAL